MTLQRLCEVIRPKRDNARVNAGGAVYAKEPMPYDCSGSTLWQRRAPLRMILNRTHGFLFVHVPKTAGMAVSHELRRFTMEADFDFCEPYDEVNSRRADETGLSKHSTAAEICEVIGAAEFNSLFKFSFVRHPYARTYSLYRFLKFNFRQWSNSAIMDTFATFDDFVASDFFQTPGPDRIFEPQDVWLTDDEGRLLVDKVAQMEKLEAELAAIYERLGLPELNEVKAVNVSGKEGPLAQLAARLPFAERLRQRIAPRRPHPVDLVAVYANDATLRIVTQRYERGFDMFGYSFAIPGSGATARVTA